MQHSPGKNEAISTKSVVTPYPCYTLLLCEMPLPHVVSRKKLILSQEKSFKNWMTGPLALKLFTIFQIEKSNGNSGVWELDAISLNLPYGLA